MVAAMLEERAAEERKEYRTLCADELCRELFRHFTRHQTVIKCWRRDNGAWVIRDDPFIDDWSKEWAKEKGAKKLYISAHSAVESRLFTDQWGVLRQKNTISGTLMRSRSTASWNVNCNMFVEFTGRQEVITVNTEHNAG